MIIFRLFHLVEMKLVLVFRLKKLSDFSLESQVTHFQCQIILNKNLIKSLATFFYFFYLRKKIKEVVIKMARSKGNTLCLNITCWDNNKNQLHFNLPLLKVFFFYRIICKFSTEFKIEKFIKSNLFFLCRRKHFSYNKTKLIKQIINVLNTKTCIEGF